MRALIWIAGAALAVSGCSKDQAADNTVNIDATATAEDIASNDTTAIDAATSDDANMAADVNYTIDEDENAADNASEGDRTTTRARPRETTPATPSDAGNSAENVE